MSTERKDEGPSRIQSMATSLASFWPHRRPSKELKVRLCKSSHLVSKNTKHADRRRVNDFPMGYPNLATFQNSSENFTVYRRFGYLQSRLLLEKQDALRVLEVKLDKYDRDNQMTSRIRSLGAETIAPRQALLGEIEETFSSYGEQQHHPGYSEVKSTKDVLCN